MTGYQLLWERILPFLELRPEDKHPLSKMLHMEAVKLSKQLNVEQNSAVSAAQAMVSSIARLRSMALAMETRLKVDDLTF